MKPRKPTSSGDYQERIRTVLDFIDGNLAEEMSVETLAAVACFSAFHFHRLFTAFMGESLNVYIRRLRLERAANLLKTFPDNSITGIALDSGFSSSAVFARSFKQHFGVSASQWRIDWGKNRKANSKIGKSESKSGKEPSFDSVYGGSGSDKDHLFLREGGEEMDLKVEIKDLAPVNMAYVRHHGGYNEKGIHRAYEKLFKWAGPRGLVGPDTRVLGLSLDNPDVTPAGKCRYDAGITVPSDAEAKGEVGIRELEGGRHAVIRYQGTKEGISSFYDDVYGKWLPESGFQPADRHSYEIYHQVAKGDAVNWKCNDGDHEHFFDLCLPVEPV